MARAPYAIPATPQAIPTAWNQPVDTHILVTDTRPGGPYAIVYVVATGSARGNRGADFTPQTGTLRYMLILDYQGADSFTFITSTANNPAASTS